MSKQLVQVQTEIGGPGNLKEKAYLSGAGGHLIRDTGLSSIHRMFNVLSDRCGNEILPEAQRTEELCPYFDILMIANLATLFI